MALEMSNASAAPESEHDKVVRELNALVEKGDMQDVGDFLGRSLSGLDARSSGHYMGHNYSVDTYFELADKKTVYWEIGGSAASHVERVEVFTPEQATRQKEILNIAEDIDEIASSAVSGGGQEAQKKALEMLELMKRINKISDGSLKKSIAKEPTDGLVLKDPSTDVLEKLETRNHVGFIDQQIELCQDWLRKTLEGKK